MRALQHAVADAIRKVAGDRGLWRQPAAQAASERLGARYLSAFFSGSEVDAGG